MTDQDRMARPLAEVDPEVYEAIRNELERQNSPAGADRQRELHLRGGARGHRQRLHQQVRRGLSRQALLRRLRVRRRGGEPGPRARQEALRGRVRQRAAALRLAGQPGRLCRRPPARRHHPGHEPGPRRTPHARPSSELLRARPTRWCPTACAARTRSSTTTNWRAWPKSTSPS